MHRLLSGCRRSDRNACIHAQPGSQFSSLKLRLATNIARVNVLDELRKRVLLTRLADMPDGDRLCHGDFHPINVLGEVSRPFVIDWPDACRGDPAADLCRSYLLLRLHAADIAEPYLDAYCRISNVTWEKVLDWLPWVRRDLQKISRMNAIGYEKWRPRDTLDQP